MTRTTPSRHEAAELDLPPSPPQTAAGGALTETEKRRDELLGRVAHIVDSGDTSKKTIRALAEARAELDLLEARIPKLIDSERAERRELRLTEAKTRIARMVAIMARLDAAQSGAYLRAFQARDAFLQAAEEALTAPELSQIAHAVAQAEARRFRLEEPDPAFVRAGSEVEALCSVGHSLVAIANGHSPTLRRALTMKRLDDAQQYEVQLHDVLEVFDD